MIHRAVLLGATLLIVAAPASGQFVQFPLQGGCANGMCNTNRTNNSSSSRKPPMTNDQRYNRMLSGLEAREKYRKRANELYLDHKEQALETARRAYALKQKEESYRSLGYLPPKPELPFTHNGKPYRNYQDFVGTPDWDAMLREATEKAATREMEVGRERERYQSAIVFERMYRRMGLAERERFSAESRYNQMIQDEAMAASLAQRHANHATASISPALVETDTRHAVVSSANKNAALSAQISGTDRNLGHENLNTAARYTKRSQQQLADGAEKLNY